nr:tyrosine-type recombinase/integrase [Bifidobacterium callitrichos]
MVRGRPSRLSCDFSVVVIVSGIVVARVVLIIVRVVAPVVRVIIWTRGMRPDALVFTSSRGNPLIRETAREAWARALDRVKLSYTNIHSMRHTAATMMARNGVPDLVRKKLIGHADIDTTDMIYTHTDALMLAKAVDGMEKLINDGGKTRTPLTRSV